MNSLVIFFKWVQLTKLSLETKTSSEIQRHETDSIRREKSTRCLNLCGCMKSTKSLWMPESRPRELLDWSSWHSQLFTMKSLFKLCKGTEVFLLRCNDLSQGWLSQTIWDKLMKILMHAMDSIDRSKVKPKQCTMPSIWFSTCAWWTSHFLFSMCSLSFSLVNWTGSEIFRKSSRSLIACFLFHQSLSSTGSHPIYKRTSTQT